jgi:hypothetical protein
MGFILTAASDSVNASFRVGRVVKVASKSPRSGALADARATDLSQRAVQKPDRREGSGL